MRRKRANTLLYVVTPGPVNESPRYILQVPKVFPGWSRLWAPVEAECNLRLYPRSCVEPMIRLLLRGTTLIPRYNGTPPSPTLHARPRKASSSQLYGYPPRLFLLLSLNSIGTPPLTSGFPNVFVLLHRSFGDCTNLAL